VAAHFNSDYCSSCLHSIAAVAFAFDIVIVVVTFTFKIGSAFTEVTIVAVVSFITNLYCNQSISLASIAFTIAVNIIKAASIKTTSPTIITDTPTIQIHRHSNSTASLTFITVPFNSTNIANLVIDTDYLFIFSNRILSPEIRAASKDPLNLLSTMVFIIFIVALKDFKVVIPVFKVVALCLIATMVIQDADLVAYFHFIIPNQTDQDPGDHHQSYLKPSQELHL
jgi:hypothetical protein